ncbi:zinc transporter ZntB [Desulfomicrobium baculatum]|uniref:Mg2 transporter protein CorA family protein n=1 Tax=Desulfomicrobium baculatum (strain DSM 4028 / VKM B-1378 / X) TaxID=525897 RepID=C7LSD4_DESBD|nr:zinc transporter ZntB [Desulfomicrobium baculatum]ACU88148.1 Mg2 transporter protein CorA family protein [Desulfomicrobium baculatum DSM 4028]
MTTPNSSTPNAYWILDGQGHGALQAWMPGQDVPQENGLAWFHLNYADATARDWLLRSELLSIPVAESLLDEETRPRVLHHGEGLLLTLRGVNLNPGAEPEDMVSIRIWIEEGRIISTRKRRLKSVKAVQTLLEAGQGPRSSGEFLAMLLRLMTDNIGEVIEALEDKMAEVEEKIVEHRGATARENLADLRRQAIALRRYLAPQREALSRLTTEQVPWMSPDDHFRIRETTDELIRHIENLDAVRERAALAHEEFVNHATEQLNRRMFMLSVVTVIFLPLGFLTGLFGINVGGIPGAASPWGFAAFCLGVALAAAGIVLIFKRSRWL